MNMYTNKYLHLFIEIQRLRLETPSLHFQSETFTRVNAFGRDMVIVIKNLMLEHVDRTSIMMSHHRK